MLVNFLVVSSWFLFSLFFLLDQHPVVIITPFMGAELFCILTILYIFIYIWSRFNKDGHLRQACTSLPGAEAACQVPIYKGKQSLKV